MLAEVFRADWGRVVASLVGFGGDVDLAEEAAADAFAVATRLWPRDGEPSDPAAWLVTTARRRLLDRLRRDRVLREKTALLRPALSEPEPSSCGVVTDERLELIFMCCHPALSLDARVALTLRTLGGLSTAEIARALLVGEETMKRRLSRAKSKIALAAVPFAVPRAEDLPARLGAVTTVLYLIFNQGYGDGRVDLAAEAIRLTRVLHSLLHALLPARPRVAALLALMLLHDARREARFDDGELVPLPEQDRARWDHRQIDEARTLLDAAIHDGADGPHVTQATIAALQVETPIDWAAVAALYAQLSRQTGSAVVELNRAAAVAETSGPAAALRIVEGLDLPDYRYFHTTRAELLRRLGRHDDARDAYRRALELTTAAAERCYLERALSHM